MASPKITQLPAVPWPAFAGASLLLHVGVLIFGLPHMVQVSNPAPTASVDIPVTLVDDEVIPVASAPTNAQSATTAPNTVVESSESGSEPDQEAQPIGGQTAAIKPVDQGVVRAQAPAPTQKTPSSTTEETARTSPKPETVNESSRELLPVQQPPTNSQPVIEGSTDATEEPDGNSENSSPGPTQVSIVDDVQLPKDSGGDQIDEYPVARFQKGVTFDIPSNHSCQGSLSTDVINLGIFIDADGLVSSLSFLQPDVYAQSSDLGLADCLFRAAVNPSAIPFSPALRLTNVGEKEIVPTDRVQLRLRFSGR